MAESTPTTVNGETRHFAGATPVSMPFANTANSITIDTAPRIETGTLGLPRINELAFGGDTWHRFQHCDLPVRVVH